jgi:hypothetical protein
LQLDKLDLLFYSFSISREIYINAAAAMIISVTGKTICSDDPLPSAAKCTLYDSLRKRSLPVNLFQ